MTLREYVSSVNKRHRSNIASEHSYRADLEILIRTLVPNIEITNEPGHVTDCGNPDYVITKGKIPVGYIEAKLPGKDLNNKIYKEQFARYKKALDNLIITDYVWFQFYRYGELVAEIKIAEILGDIIKELPNSFTEFENLIQNFCTYVGQTIKSSKRLAELMASKARLLQNILERAVTSDEQTAENTSLKEQYQTFKKILIHDLNPKEFADIYAQTLAYGMFAARLHDTTPDNFSREEAAQLIPKTNPFLRKLFQYVAGYDIDERIKPTVDNLADVFRATNVDELLKNFGKSTQMHDPVIHFYETFLAEYDPKLRKSRGVWYTPAPVVNFIVRAVDDILKTEFGLSQGLSDTSKTKIKVHEQGVAKLVEKEVHKVQILDPATGTGTFLAEVVKQIYNKNFTNIQGAWGSYVEEHLIPRLNGFELLMASYTIAHLKLDMLLADTGYKTKKEQRFNIYLTNSLEEHHPDTGTVFANWLSTEANEANHIKRDTPVMVVLGNPPYSVSSSNKSEWIEKLTADYKKDLNERNIQPLSDDYIKFIRFGEHYINKTGEGILAYISNNSFIDGIIHRRMRKHLLETFDKIYILDLHGNAKKRETAPDGSSDQNVFDIMQGVSINIFVKNKTGSKKLARVFHYNLFGQRDEKYEFLRDSALDSINWNDLFTEAPNFFFVKKAFNDASLYGTGFSVADLFPVNTLGIEFGSKEYFLNSSKQALANFISDEVLNTKIPDEDIAHKFGIKSTSGWRFSQLRRDEIVKGFQPTALKECLCTPFDIRYTYHAYILRRSQFEVLKHLHHKNIALISLRQTRGIDQGCYFLSNRIFSKDSISIIDRATGFPLYLYPDTSAQLTLSETTARTPNLNLEIVKKIANAISLTFTNERDETPGTFAPMDILDYIYAVLHSSTYREKYKEFLKIDFPRVPYPQNDEIFWQLVKLGGELRQVHLLEGSLVEKIATTYPVNGNNEVNAISYKEGRVFINEAQYFANVPDFAWSFFIGGYQPAQKWLKDRKGRVLSFEDILHYQKIITALTETNRLMKEVDNVAIC